MEKTRCTKCGFESEENLKKFGSDICKICFTFTPNSQEEFKGYINEKIPSSFLDSFRKFYQSPGLPQKNGMIQKATKGEVMSRPPFGYIFQNKKLIPAQNSDEIREIFEEFLTSNNSLRTISRKHNLSVNGLKKVLRNFTYIGKVKFNGQIHEGTHKPIISSTLFNHVQSKLERLGIKKN